MSKMKKLLVLLLVVLQAFVCVMPVFFENVAFAEAVPSINIDLIGKDITDNTASSLTGGEISLYTPYDETKENGLMGGRSITPKRTTIDDNGTAKEKFDMAINVLPVGNTSYSKDMNTGKANSLYFWWYNEAKGLDLSAHSIKLKIDDKNYLEWTLSQQDLLALFGRTGEESVKQDAWFLIELPLTMLGVVETHGVVTETINGTEMFKQFTSLTITETAKLPAKKPTNEYFYNFYINTSKNQSVSTIKKQGFASVKFNFNIPEFVYIEDTLTVPTFASGLKYAWFGDVNILLRGSEYFNILYREAGTDKYVARGFGDKIKLDYRGQYSFALKYFHSDVQEYIFAETSFTAKAFTAFNIGAYNNRPPIGQTFIIEIAPEYESLAITELNSENFSVVSSDPNIIEVVSIDYKLGQIKIKAVSNGNASVTFTIKSARKNNAEVKEYSSLIKLRSGVQDKDSSSKIVMIVIVCIAVAGLGGILIYRIVKSNKINP
ncbi:MAG: hypothetical protein RR334_00695 [Clostridia bacterium]